jgi:hypothetical protein
MTSCHPCIKQSADFISRYQANVAQLQKMMKLMKGKNPLKLQREMEAIQKRGNRF